MVGHENLGLAILVRVQTSQLNNIDEREPKREMIKRERPFPS